MKVEKLALQYCECGAIEPKYSAYNNKYIPTNDAHIMAEATVLGVPLVTENIRDFIRSKKTTENDILKKITRCNADNGYMVEKDSTELYYTPKPYSVGAFIHAFYKAIDKLGEANLENDIFNLSDLECLSK